MAREYYYLNLGTDKMSKSKMRECYEKAISMLAAVNKRSVELVGDNRKSGSVYFHLLRAGASVEISSEYFEVNIVATQENIPKAKKELESLVKMPLIQVMSRKGPGGMPCYDLPYNLPSNL